MKMRNFISHAAVAHSSRSNKRSVQVYASDLA